MDHDGQLTDVSGLNAGMQKPRLISPLLISQHLTLPELSKMFDGSSKNLHLAAKLKGHARGENPNPATLFP
jgi:hypothetical protein